jgi:hypothetical protein
MKFSTFDLSLSRQQKVSHTLKNRSLSSRQRSRLEALREKLERRICYTLFGPVRRRSAIGQAI